MDDKSRLLIDEMLAEEQFYFGTDSMRRGASGGSSGAAAGASPDKAHTQTAADRSGYGRRPSNSRWRRCGGIRVLKRMGGAMMRC